MPSATAIDYARLARELELSPDAVARTVALLDGGNTVPFITRYRRDQTGGLDEQQITRIRDGVTHWRQLDERKQTILRTIESQNKLTDELRRAIEHAESVKRLEDLYLPFRPKKQSLATRAREQGLVPLAEEILAGAKECADLDARAADFVNPDKGVTDAALALLGAGHVLAEEFSERADLRQRVRKLFRKSGRLVSTKIDDNEKKNRHYRDYLNFREAVHHIPPHRILAINRGERANVLRVKFDADERAIEQLAFELLVPAEHPHKEFLTGCVKDALVRLVLPSLERETRRELTDKAELHAVEVFAKNLRNLLLQPPLIGKRVLAIDPGYKNGCKLAVIDELGSLVERALIHIVGGDEQKAAARTKLIELIKSHHVSVIAIGNGTACRQTEQLLADVLANELAGEDVHYVVVNEAGASVYSTSEIGREEFPECDALERSAISIGRRLQDPLSELVKIDPASIGVGLYQHDTRAKHLRDTLDEVVQLCVSFVGVDVNSASSALLRYVSGMNQLTARRVYEHRQQHGPFTCRQQLLDVNGFGEATFVQAAGFLKIDKGGEPLDATWIHPENYAAARQLLERLGIEPASLTEPGTADRIRELVTPFDPQQLAEELGLGLLAVDDMIEALTKPGRDLRSDLPPPIFRKDVVKFEDLAIGMELRGTVLNVVDFGAFVDVGLSDSGLVHVSQLSAGFVRSPHDVVAVGAQVRVWVASIDRDRRRVALTMIEPGTEKEHPPRQHKPRRKPQPRKAAVAAGERSEQSRSGRPRSDRPKRRQDRSRRPPQRTGAYEKRAVKSLVPITKEMEEGKEYLRSFGDLLQFHEKKQNAQPEPNGAPANDQTST